MSKTYIKLKNVGEDATFLVTRCEPGSGRYPDVEFEDENGNVYPMPKSAAERQLDRAGRTMDTVVGHVVRISRGENKQDASKPFWNLEVVGGAERNGGGNGRAASAARQTGHTATHTTTSATAQPRPATRADVERELDAEPAEPKKSGYALYRQITERVLADMPTLYKNAGVPLTADATAAIVATLYIQANRNGH